MTEAIDLARLYDNRFDARALARKRRVWGVLCRSFFQGYVGRDETVLDLGAGACEFLHSIECGRRLAVDTNPGVRPLAGSAIEVLPVSSTNLEGVGDGSVDVVFASNFFEHLPDTEALLATLRETLRVLRPGGRLLVLQPNIAAVGGRYWDFLDHHLPLTERTVAEALTLVGFELREVRARFLPYTTRSRLPQHPALVWLYLKLPFIHRFMGGQAFICAIRPAAVSE